MSRVLLLQGPIGPLFADFGQELTRRGHRVSQVCFNGGDEYFSCPQARRYKYRQGRQAWLPWLLRLVQEERPACVVLFGDCRPLHRLALRLMAKRGIPTYVFEEGYFRPFFLTLEAGGVNANSQIPRKPGHYGREAPQRVCPRAAFRYIFLRRMWNCIIYYMMMAARGHVYAEYQHHRCPKFVREAGAWIRSACRFLWYRRRDRVAVAGVKPKSYFLVPLQVAGDSQVRHHSEFASVSSFIVNVVKSFAKKAPKEASLVIKHHPMDRGYRDYTDLLAVLTRQLGLEGRIVYVRDVPLPRLLSDARGVITINSTVGLSALIHGTPTITLGSSIYSIPGLTDQRGLDSFWHDQQAVDMGLLHRFQHYLMATTQIPGTTAARGNGWDLLDQLEQFRSEEHATVAAETTRRLRRQRKSGRRRAAKGVQDAAVADGAVGDGQRLIA